MKQNVKFIIFIFLLNYLYGCSKIGIKSNTNILENNTTILKHSLLKRLPSSVFRSCNQIFDTITSRSSRRGELLEAIKSGDFIKFKNIFWNDYNSRLYTTGNNVFSKFYYHMRRINQNANIPNFFNKTDNISGDIDTFSTISNVTNESFRLSDDEKKAIEDVKKWIEFLKNSKKNINEKLQNGYEFTRSILESKDILQGDKKIIRAKFPKVIPVPIVYDDGQTGSFKIKFYTLEEYKLYLTDIKYKKDRTLSQNWFADLFYSSAVDNEMLKNALMYRRLKLLYRKLTVSSKLSVEQQQLKEEIFSVLHNDLYKPRQDIMNVILRKEYKSELWQYVRFWQKKRIIYNPKYKLPEGFTKAGKYIKPIMFLRTMVVFSSLGSAAYTTLEDNPHSQYIIALLNNYFNYFLVFGLGFQTSSLQKCYDSARDFTLLKSSTLVDFTESILSRYRALSRIDPTYNPENDPEYVRQRIKLQSFCLKSRLEHKKAEFFNKDIAASEKYAITFTAHSILADLIKTQYNQKIADDVSEYLYQSEVSLKSEAQALKIKQLSLIISSELGSDFLRNLNEYQKNVQSQKLKDAILDGSFNHYYKNYNIMMNNVQKYTK